MTFGGHTDTEPFIRRGREVAHITGVSYTRERVTDNLSLSFKVPDAAAYSIAVLPGNGDGTFQSARTFVQNIFPGRLTAGDFNQDRLADIVTANQGTTIGVVTNTSARTGADVAANIFTGGTVQDLIYRVVASNRGPRAATNVVLTDLAPANSFFVSASNTQGTCSQTGSSITCDFGSLAAGAFAFAQIQVVTPPPPFSVTDSATVTANEFDPNTKNNIATNTFKYP